MSESEKESTSLLALGTMSDKNSRSFDDNAMELRGLVVDDLVLENRVKNRETADGGGGVGSRSGGGGKTLEGPADAVDDKGDETTGDEDEKDVLCVSRLGLGDTDGSALGLATGETGLSVTGGVIALRPKKDNKPPADFCFVSITGGVTSFSFGTTRHPAGTISSCDNSGRAFTEASQAVEPFDAA